jgi:hypothetical protein
VADLLATWQEARSRERVLYHRRRRDPGEGFVELRDLRPVGLLRSRRLHVQRGDRGLQLVGPRLPQAQRGVERTQPLPQAPP